jgi:hypothetical protein
MMRQRGDKPEPHEVMVARKWANSVESAIPAIPRFFGRTKKHKI